MKSKVVSPGHSRAIGIDQNATFGGWRSRNPSDFAVKPGIPRGTPWDSALHWVELAWDVNLGASSQEWLSSSRGLVAAGLLTYTWDEGSTANRSTLDWWNLQLTFSQPLGKPMVSSFPMAVPFHHPFSIRNPQGPTCQASWRFREEDDDKHRLLMKLRNPQTKRSVALGARGKWMFVEFLMG